jgi:dihydrodipicolinate synthase/N-acetylneuraminate lyase
MVQNQTLSNHAAEGDDMSAINQDPLSGVYVFSITPTMPDGAVNEQVVRELVDHFIGMGVDGVTMFGSTGNVASFTEAERKRVAEIAVEQARGRVPIMIGTGAITTAESVRLSRHAASIRTGCAHHLLAPDRDRNPGSLPSDIGCR